MAEAAETADRPVREVAILCSGVALGVYLPGLEIARGLRRHGVRGRVFVLEAFQPAEVEDALIRARIGRHKIHLDIAHASGERERVSFDEQNYYLNQLACLAGDARDQDWPAQAQRSVERIAMLEALHGRLRPTLGALPNGALPTDELPNGALPNDR